MIDLRLGDYKTALDDVRQVDAVITDPPYGARTHDDESLSKQVVSATGQATRTRLSYSAWTPDDVREFVAEWAPRCRGWFVAMTSHDLIPAWEQAYRDAGRYSFAPVPWIDKRPRLVGDGPSSWACYIMVSRPKDREFATWGCLPGAYLPGEKPAGEKKKRHIGGKPLWLMRELVRDYTRTGELVCDPCAGGGTTLIAAAMQGREAVGAEVDPDTFTKAKAWIDEGHTPDLFALTERTKKEKPVDLFGGQSKKITKRELIPCEVCEGTGRRDIPRTEIDGGIVVEFEVEVICRECDGTGYK